VPVAGPDSGKARYHLTVCSIGKTSLRVCIHAHSP
jgi:hypothetical protein